MSGGACRWPEKHAHHSKGAALAAIEKLEKAGKGSPEMDAYPCPAGHWHVGHSVRKFEKRIRASLTTGRSRRSIYRRRAR